MIRVSEKHLKDLSLTRGKVTAFEEGNIKERYLRQNHSVVLPSNNHSDPSF